jgi:hypothetical protein
MFFQVCLAEPVIGLVNLLVVEDVLKKNQLPSAD